MKRQPTDRHEQSRRWIRLTVTLVAAWLATPSPTRAQAGGGFPSAPGSGAVMVGAALEPELIVSIGYLHRLDAGTSPWRLAAGARLKIPPYLLGNGAGRVSVMATGGWIDETGWGATLSSAGYLARDRNRAGTMHGFGIEARAAPGYHGAGWSVAADVGWQGTLVSHIEHSDLVREAFRDRHPGVDHGGPVDGWYGLTAQRFRFGVMGARKLGDDLSIQLAAGALFSRQRQGLLLSFAHGQVPVYLEASMRAGR